MDGQQKRELTYPQMEWAKARDELVEAIRFLGFPEELGYDIAKELGLSLIHI